jgi:hypothetical protein
VHNAAIVRGNVVCPSNFSGLVASITIFDTVPILAIHNELLMTIKALNAQSGKKNSVGLYLLSKGRAWTDFTTVRSLFVVDY